MTYTDIIPSIEYGGLTPTEFGHQDCTPSYGFGPCMRPHWLLHYVVSGFGFYELEDKKYPIKPGDIFVIPPYVQTYYQADEAKPWSYIWVAFTSEDDELPSSLLKPVMACPEAGEIFQDMKKSKTYGNGKSAFLASCIWKLLATLMEQRKPIQDDIDKALSYLHSGYMKQITIQGIANYLNMDRSHFSTAFTKRVGVSPQQYLLNLRLSKAAELMVTYHKTPSVAALSVGYSDLSLFSKMFKQHFGMSPRAYIKHHVT